MYVCALLLLSAYVPCVVVDIVLVTAGCLTCVCDASTLIFDTFNRGLIADTRIRTRALGLDYLEKVSIARYFIRVDNFNSHFSYSSLGHNKCISNSL